MTLFPGYNLRGLIFDYLEDRGWRWKDGAWARGDLVFTGPSATDQAVHHQIETEEGRT